MQQQYCRTVRWRHLGSSLVRSMLCAAGRADRAGQPVCRGDTGRSHAAYGHITACRSSLPCPFHQMANQQCRHGGRQMQQGHSKLLSVVSIEVRSTRRAESQSIAGVLPPRVCSLLTQTPSHLRHLVKQRSRSLGCNMHSKWQPAPATAPGAAGTVKGAA